VKKELSETATKLSGLEKQYSQDVKKAFEELSATKKELAEASTRLASLEKQYAQDVKDLKATLATKESELNVVKIKSGQDLFSIQRELDETCTSLEKKYSEEMWALTKEIDSCRGALAAKESELSVVRNESDTMRGQLESQVTELQDKVSVIEQARLAEIASLKKQHESELAARDVLLLEVNTLLQVVGDCLP
jgi:predicted  nucleic acid-binding Zn-ribbon protein